MEFLLTFLTRLHARIGTSRYCRQHSYTLPSFDGWAAGLAETWGSSSDGSFAAKKSKVSFCPTLFSWSSRIFAPASKLLDIVIVKVRAQRKELLVSQHLAHSTYAFLANYKTDSIYLE